MSRIVWIAGLASGLAFSGWAIASPAQAADEREQAIGFAREGRCGVALELFAEFRTEPGNDALVEQLVGECALRAQRFRFAEAALGRARSLDPATPQVDLHLAMAHFHQGEIDEAAAALSRASASDAEQPEFLLYSGLVAMERSEYESAARTLAAASRLSDAAPEPMASFFLARSLAELDRLDEAELAFDRVIEMFPESEWASQAAAAKRAARSGNESDIQYWASAELGFEHDDNVLLRGFSVSDQPADPASNRDNGQSDQRGFWFVDAGAMVDLSPEWRLGGLLRYSGTDHLDQFEFDSHTPGGTVWFDRMLSPRGSALRFQYDFDATWVDKDPFVHNHAATTSFYHPWEVWGYSVLSAAYGRSDFDYKRFDVVDANVCQASDPLCGPVGVNERERTNRSGDGMTLSAFHRLPIEFENPVASNLYVSGEYLFHRYWARGSEYDHQRHQVEVELGGTLPLEIALRIGGRFAYVPYDNNSVFPDPPVPRIYALPSRQRREREVGIWVRAEREWVENVTLSAHFRRTRNFSNTEVFDYDRNVVGLSIRVALGG